MADARPKLAAALTQVNLTAPQVPVMSNVTAQYHGSPEDIHRLLGEQVTSSVLWEKSMRELLAQGFTRFIELGPGNALTGFMKRIDKTVQVLNIADVPTLAASVKVLQE
jgi:[acyl-carrier-protein] S-malonyltransferase